MVGCQEYLPLSPSHHAFFLLSIFASYGRELTVTGHFEVLQCAWDTGKQPDPSHRVIIYSQGFQHTLRIMRTILQRHGKAGHCAPHQI